MIIEFQEVLIKNFMSIGEAEVSLSNRGLTLVRGINNYEPKLDSNGSGKSALFESIIWTLTGLTTRNSKDISNKYTTDNKSYVTLVFLLNGLNYVVTRIELPKKSLIILEEGKDISGSTYTKSCEILSSILGELTYDRLISIILLSQGLPGKFSELSPSSRKSRLESLSGTDDYLQDLVRKVDQYFFKTESLLSEFSKSISKLEGYIESLHNSNIKLQESLLERNKYSIEEFEETKKALEVTTTKLSELKKDSLRIKDSLESASLEFHKLKSIEASLDLEISKIKTSIESYSKNKCPLCGSTRNFSQELNSSMDNLSNKLEDLANTSLRIIDIEDLRKSLTKEYQIVSEEFNNLEVSYHTLNTEFHKMEISHIISNDLYKTIESNELDITQKSLELGDLKKHHETLKIELSKISFLKNNLNKSFRTYLVESVVAFMNTKLEDISKYLYEIQGSVSIKCSGNNIRIYLGDRDIQTLSGGELRRVDLILQLAQRSICEVYSGFSCNLLVLDEILDYLDTQGVNNVLSMMESNALGVNTIMIVTHRPELDLANDSEIVMIKESNQISRVLE